jgi:hypothetical protein
MGAATLQAGRATRKRDATGVYATGVVAWRVAAPLSAARRRRRAPRPRGA